MSVKQKAKEFEDRQSIVGGSPPTKNKSREELIENISDDHVTHAKENKNYSKNDQDSRSSSPPIPPPRKYKKNGTLINKESECTSPTTEWKENVQVISPPNPANVNSLPTKQCNVTEQKKKKPKPPPPPRGSSLGHKTSMPTNLQASSGGKKPRPPVPPKPKNYVPKRRSLQRNISANSEVQSVVHAEKEGDGSSPLVSETGGNGDHGLKSYFDEEKGKCTSNEVHSKSANSENVSEIFVLLDKHSASEKPSTEGDSLFNGQIPSQSVVTNGNEEAINGLERGKLDNFEVNENGVGLSQCGMMLYGHKIVSRDLNSGKQSPDPLESLELECDALIENDDYDDDDIKINVEQNKENTPLFDSGENEVVATDISGELNEESASYSKENVKVICNLVLEEECSVTMIDNTAEAKKLADDTPTEINDVVQMVEVKSSEGIGELSDATEHIVNDGQRDERVDATEGNRKCEDESESIVAEPLVVVKGDLGNVGESGVEKAVSVESMSDEDFIEDTQQNIVGDVAFVEELHGPSVQQRVTEVGVDFVSQESELKYDETENDDVIHVAITSAGLVQNEAQENGGVILAEPVREGTLISVADHTVSKGNVELVSEEDGNTAHESATDEEAGTEENEGSETVASVPENETVSEPSFESPSEERKAKTEDCLLVNDIHMHSYSAEVSSEVSSEVTVEERNNKENLREFVLDVKVDDGTIEREQIINQAVKLDPTADSDSAGVEAIATGTVTTLSDSSVEDRFLEKLEDVSEMLVSDVGNSSKGLEDVEISATDLETLDHKEDLESKDSENDSETRSLSPEPVRPERQNRKAMQGKHSYENVDFGLMVENRQQTEEKRKNFDSLSRRSHSFSKYEDVVHSPSSPVQRVSDDDAIYRVPRQVISVHCHVGGDDAVYSTPCAVTAHSVVKDNIYAVPKPILVQAHAVLDREKKDKGVEVYATPGLPTSVPVTECKKEEVSSSIQVNDATYVVPRRQKTPTVTGSVSASPPPKPPRMSLILDQDKKEKEKSDVEKVTPAGSPQPVPRTRVVGGDSSPGLYEQRSSPTPAPRKGSKNEASESRAPKDKAQESSPSPVHRQSGKTDASEVESMEHRASPSPVPRKTSKMAQGAETPDSPAAEGNGSPSPIPRSRLNALKSNQEVASRPPLASPTPKIFVEEGKEDQTPSKRKTAPPRPPPPVNRMSVVNSESTMLAPDSPGHDLESDTDSDVEEPAPKGPAKPKTYYIAHEILSTERSFVDALKLVFEECYGTIKAANVVADTVLTDIFRDLENIYLLDSRFLQELEERMITWEEHERIGDIIKKYGHFLKMYTQYVNGYDKAMGIFQDTMKENSEFANLVTQFQASERCHGLVLSSYMLKPVQRIPSYRLLLIDYLKHLPKDSEEFKDTETALKIVSEVATHINESMKKMDSFEQLLKLQSMLVGNPEIVKAGRDYLREGMLMKLCRKDMQERMFFLLTDVLLYTTPIGGNQYKLNKMLPLLGMLVTLPDSPDLVNEFSIISTTRSFTLTASTPEERDEWVEALKKAIEEVTKRKITFVSKARDATRAMEQETDGATKLGEKAPVWIPDARVTMCMSCTKPFTAINRRHHCRACGKVVCGSCSESNAPLAYLVYNQARVCDKCYDLLLKEFHTDEIHIDPDDDDPVALPPLLQESDDADKLLRKPTKFEIMRRFRSKKTKRKSQIIHPTHLTEVVANQGGSQMSGYLRYKKGRHGWKKSWFVLKGNVLYSYKANSDVVALETLPVLGYAIEDQGKDGDDLVFQLKHQGVPPIVFKADNETSGKRWIQELKKAATMDC